MSLRPADQNAQEPKRDESAPRQRMAQAYDSVRPGGPAQETEGVDGQRGVDVSSTEALRVYREERGTTYAGACSGALLNAREDKAELLEALRALNEAVDDAKHHGWDLEHRGRIALANFRARALLEKIGGQS